MIKRYAPDTNFFLQFRKPQELPWQEITKAEQIELVVLNGVLSELDNHKNVGNERRARRSRDVISILRPLFVEDQVEIVLRESEPRLSYRLAPDLPPNRPKPSNLDLTSADARIVEEAVACGALFPDSQLTLLSHDGVPLKLARSVGLDRQALPESWRLPSEPDPKDKEIARLQDEIQLWKKRAPAVDVVVRLDGKRVERIDSTLPRYAPLQDSELDRLMGSILQEYPEEASNIAGQVTVHRSEDLVKYRHDRAAWEASLRGSLSRYHNLLNLQSSILRLELTITNDGHASADHLVVDVRAEGDVRLVDLESHAKWVEKLKPGLPEPPRMRHPMDLFNSGIPAEMKPAFRGFNHLDLTRGNFGPPGRHFSWNFDEPETASDHALGTCGDFRHKIHREVLMFGICISDIPTRTPEGCIRIRFSAKNLLNPTELVWPVRFGLDWLNCTGHVRGFLREQLHVGE